MATPEETDLLVPPAEVAMIDGFLHELADGSSLISSARAVDMLLDIRHTLWVENELAESIGPVLDANAKAKQPVAPR